MGQLLNPELTILAGNDVYRRFPIGARTTAAVEWDIGQRSTFRLTPYFQTDLTNYNKRKLKQESSNYRPYGFGLNLGIAFEG